MLDLDKNLIDLIHL
jgi:ribosomal protein L24